MFATTCGKERPTLPVPSALSGAKRLTEPILSGYGTWQPCESRRPNDDAVMKQAVCGATGIVDPVSLVNGKCNHPMRTMTDAVRLLAETPTCTDAAVEKLQAIADERSEPEVLSNLAAAYFIRAQRKDQAFDLVPALDAADAALALAPDSIAAHFNRALAEEMLGLTDDATKSWDTLRREAPTGWSTEAEQHWSRLTRQHTLSAATQWPLNEQRLPEVARTNDAKAVEALITTYRGPAQKLVEEKVLPAWAKAKASGDEVAATEQLHLAEMIAAALAKLTHDNYLRDVLRHLRSADGRHEIALRRGLGEFVKGMAEERKIKKAKVTAALYGRAVEWLEKARSPLRLGVMARRASMLILDGRADEATDVLTPVEAEAKQAGYPSILARAYSARGYSAMMESRFLDYIAEYSNAEAIYRQIGDDEGVCSVLTRKIGVYRLIGNHRLTWEEILKTLELVPSLPGLQTRHLMLGETAIEALALGHPKIALRYQNTAVALLRDDLAKNANNDELADGLQAQLRIAFRARAAIEAHLGNQKAAQRDLAEAGEPPDGDDAIQNGFRARIAEVEAQTLAKTDRRRAIEAISKGIDYASHSHFSSLKASLLVQRADLYRLDQNGAAEIADLKAALIALRKEELATLKPQSLTVPPVAEQLWSSFFARYQDTYRRLIQRHVEDGNDAGAFDYAEQARAFEPLHLILKQPEVPAEFRAHIHGGEPFHLADVMEVLPAGTFLLQYAVLENV
ncbi:MAG TPA: hypothetical protein VGD79_03135, partial [Thermoanaerobaculia bacterium]